MAIASTVPSHSILLFLSSVNTLLSLIFVLAFSWCQNVDHVKLNNARFISSLLIVLVQVILVIISRTFSIHLGSYALGLDPTVILTYWLYIQRVKLKSIQVPPDHPLQVQIQGALIPKKFDIKEIKDATSNFKELVAISHFCKVFRGSLVDGNTAGIMRIRCPKDHKTHSAIVNEISTISHSKHDNIMKLLGYCLTPDFVYFVYEYMENHRLKDWIFSKDTDKRRTLTMEVRYQVGVDVAKALGYLNNHRKNFLLDVNPSSVLLDGKFKAKVTDFGLWRLLVQTKGNLDDMSPTICEVGKSTEKCNVYRYGVFLLELVSGQKHWHHYEYGEIMNMLYWKLKQEKHMYLVDQIMVIDKVDEAHLLGLLNVALLCVQKVSENRPTMAQVVAMLVGHEPVPSIQEIPSASPTMFNYDLPSAAEDYLSSDDDKDEIFLWSQSILSSN